MTTLDLLKRMQEAVEKQLNDVRIQMSKTDQKDADALARLKNEARVLQECMIYCDSTRLNAGLK